ncbi:response regulator [Sunxiuqinia elliptica]|uniref:CheY-like chemotaxis protein n=1 Tax=Sunxiuqinia elliptica TaxID=655355 RepID=A0A1I2J266_9BACT|nr:response regulator [Sunxiuqinia elliptica]TDN98378.1 CheY-like chemotaxis protein [Sunxiuqinia elliptica]TDO60483.1 CheY-like chemotaxis protein [Sunxiuqinia elliptica]SFF48822.1 hypothetical protein SAMN05216283_107161 [Sunxiuqinia elliptica]
MSMFKPSLSGRTVLVVEDNEVSRIYFKVALEKAQADVIMAGDGREAVRLFQENEQIDLVLMDLNMPGLNGFEATKMIKALRPNVPVIAQSAYVMAGEELDSINAGCDEFLSKPVRLNDLFAMLERYLSQV